MSNLGRIAFITAFITFLPIAASAQWMSQTIHMDPGWNSVFLELDPYPNDPESLFAGIPVESVWTWNRQFSSIQFLQDPNVLKPQQPEWLTYFPPGGAESALTNMHILRGGKSYLIKLGGSASVDWVVSGIPNVRPHKWMGDSYNLVGFRLDSASPPTFQSFFWGQAEFADLEIYELDSAGDWQPVANPAASKMRQGAAYWLFCEGQSSFDGQLSTNVKRAIEFDSALNEYRLLLRNASDSDKSVIIRQLPSTAPADPDAPLLAGEIPLSRHTVELSAPDKFFGWREFSDPLTLDVPAQGSTTVRLSVRRRDMTPFAPPAGREALYQNLLEISDGEGTQLFIPVSAKSSVDSESPAAVAAAQQRSKLLAEQAMQEAEEETTQYAGLWAGTVSISAVSESNNTFDSTTATPTAKNLDFRVIVHHDALGQSRLLQQVTLMFKNGTYKVDPEDPDKQIVDEPGRYVLVTDDEKIGDFYGATLIDGQAVGQRLSSVAFGFREPLGGVATGAFGEPGTEVSFTIDMPYDDPLNPYLHKYHPDHDNLNFRFDGEKRESYSFTRTITLEFSADDPDGSAGDGSAAVDWGDGRIGGIFKETISGIHKNDIFVEGNFRLGRVSKVSMLNDKLEVLP